MRVPTPAMRCLSALALTAALLVGLGGSARAVRQADPGDGQGVRLRRTGPGFYIAFLPAKTDPVKLGEGAPKSCKVQIGNPKTGGEEADCLAKAFAQLAAPVSATKALSIDCNRE